MSTAPHIQEYYKILDIPSTASDEEVNNVYKRLARKFHPDKNRNRLEWAHENIIRLNQAYSSIMSYRFRFGPSVAPGPEKTAEPDKEPAPQAQQKTKRKPSRPVDHRLEEINREITINSFIRIREKSKDSLYRFFQYRLYNIIRRDEVFNRGIFNEIVYSLRRSYQNIKKLRKESKDSDIHRHLDTFNDMIFNFYKASECLNIIDSYSDLYDVEAYRQYKQADEHLHSAQQEVFFDRHNRGYHKLDYAMSQLKQAINLFKSVLKLFPESSWTIETEIKLKYAESLRQYIILFFYEEE